ncbi:MFS transporter [Lipingzhangella sp. LS1_29]|uniref:MFS transporter n=1 Tax=Lipingzhangella rawalii TaxID=2055835 RepID=A0ABU2HCD0_9ACTN|nr:MFS transporter [Lipingzhangella rawalii]MDS1272657.1 MFS transporter [Lipingzhangella rawalii]
MAIGVSLFGLASFVAAFSPNPETLIVMRGLLGAAGATLMPASYAIMRTTFRDRKQLTVAIAVQMSAFTAGMALGTPMAGLLLEFFWWGAVFLVNVPVAALTLTMAPLLPEPRDETARPLDLWSVALSLGGIIAVIFGL